MRILLAIAYKEFLHIRRDPKTMIFIVGMPILLLIFYGYAINFDIDDIQVGIVDYDHTAESRELIDSLTQNNYFTLSKYRNNADELLEDLNHRYILVGMVIPRGFAADLRSGDTSAQVQFLIDGSDGNTATIAFGYVSRLGNDLNLSMINTAISERLGGASPRLPLLESESRFLYNPELKSSDFIVPGIIAIILMLTGSVATTLTVVREKENNTIEQLIVSQASALQIIFGKLIPYVVLSFLAVIVILFAAFFLFGITVKSSILLLALMTIVYLVGVLGIGILISSLVDSMAPAMLISMLVSVLPSVLLSGFVFSIRNMPAVLQWISMVVPARYFIIIMRGLYLKGVGLEILWPQLLFIALFAFIVFTVAILRFRKRLD